ncbi:MAG: hypothetical protein RMX68_020240 [Aulosira sp. ZfuVER01]|nr:hypothetical protein [Aulosira sp. ZfuVER01]MDZ7997104.1 hypothetical protein [Aulosira sp. DedVER01a]MDZ8054276.1 hypothetical protein [Aulosira sp. ZfuCHP01]
MQNSKNRDFYSLRLGNRVVVYSKNRTEGKQFLNLFRALYFIGISDRKTILSKINP